MLESHSIPPERWLYTLPLRLRALFRRSQLDQDLDEELQVHLEETTQEYIDSGLSAEEARYAALRDFGNVELAKQNCRDARKVLWFQNLIEDLHFGLRSLRKAPGFTALAIVMIALGIAANTVVFSVLHAALLRPLPYAHPENLVSLSESTPDVPVMFIALANFADWQARNKVFENMGAFRRSGATLTGRGDPRHVMTGQVTSGLFPTLGVDPVVGRAFRPEDDKPGAAPVLLLSDTLWAKEFARDPTVVGTQLRLDGETYTIIGVMPTSRFPLYWREMDVFSSLGRLSKHIGGEAHRADHLGVSAYARLKPGVSVRAARADMAGIARQLEQQHPQTNAGQSVLVQPLDEKVVGSVRRPLELLMGSVVLVLLIACVNVASLLTSRAVVRRREIAIRGALGAGTARLTFQLLCESTPLALMGGALGLLLAYCLMPVLARQTISIVPRAEDMAINGPVLAFTFLVSVGSGIFFGVVPALASYRIRPTEAFQQEGSATRIHTLRVGLRTVLAAAELAMALVLLIGAGLTIKSLVHIVQIDTGLQTDGVLTGVVTLPRAKYADDGQAELFMRNLVRKVSALPGVTAAGFQSPSLQGGSQGSFRIEGDPVPAEGQERYSEFASVTPGALQALGVRLLRGRFFTWSDRADAPLVCVVDDSLADRYWPGEDPLGKKVGTEMGAQEGKTAWWTIVGVIHRVQTDATDQQRLVEIYVPYSQFPGSKGRLLVRSPMDPAKLTPMLRSAVRSLDPDLPLYDVRSLADVLQENVAGRRLTMMLLSVFAAIALLLAALGVYGVMAYMVAGRRKEIGVRLALGAKPRDILRLILGQVVPVVVAGTVVGVLSCLALSRTLRVLLFEVSPADPGTISVCAALLVCVALVACFVPARNAMTIDPVRVLHRE